MKSKCTKKIIFTLSCIFLLQNIFANEDKKVQSDQTEVEFKDDETSSSQSKNAIYSTKEKRRRSLKETVPASSFVYNNLTALKLEAGKADFSDCYPLTIGELKNYLFEIEYNNLSESGKKYYDQIMEYFNEGSMGFNSSIFSVKTNPLVNLEGYYKSNDSLTWINDRYTKSPLLEIPAVMTLGDYASFYANLIIAQSKNAMDLKSSYNYINFPWPFYERLDVNFPDDTISSVGYNFTDTCGINFSIGSTPRSIGRTLLGSSIMSTFFTGAAYAEFEVYSPDIKLTSGVTQFNVNRYFYTHRSDFRLFNKFTFTVFGGTLVYSPLELRFLNPFTIFHGQFPMRDYASNSNDSHDCAVLAFRAEYVPVKNLRLYALYMQDQLQTNMEKMTSPNDPTPNAMGGQVGIESYIPYKSGSFHLAAEAYYAQPYLYIKQSPNWSLMRTFHEDLINGITFYEWLGSPYGPDTIAGQIKFGYEVPKKWSVEGSYTFAARGEMSDKAMSALKNLNWGTQFHRNGSLEDSDGNSIDDKLSSSDSAESSKSWVYPTTDDSDYLSKRDLITPTGTAEYVNSICIKASYKITDYLSLSLMPAFKFIFNCGHTKGTFESGAEITLGAKLDLAKIINFSFDLSK